MLIILKDERIAVVETNLISWQNVYSFILWKYWFDMVFVLSKFIQKLFNWNVWYNQYSHFTSTSKRKIDKYINLSASLLYIPVITSFWRKAITLRKKCSNNRHEGLYRYQSNLKSLWRKKNNLSLVVRPFKENKNGIYFFWISSLVPQIFKFLFKIDDVTNRFGKE